MVELTDVLNLESDEDEKINEAVKQLFSFKEKNIDIKTKTDLTIKEIGQLTRLKLIAEIFKVDVLNELCDNYCLFLVSKNRLGRTEMVDIIRNKENEDKLNQKNLFNRFLK